MPCTQVKARSDEALLDARDASARDRGEPDLTGIARLGIGGLEGDRDGFDESRDSRAPKDTLPKRMSEMLGG